MIHSIRLEIRLSRLFIGILLVCAHQDKKRLFFLMKNKTYFLYILRVRPCDVQTSNSTVISPYDPQQHNGTANEFKNFFWKVTSRVNKLNGTLQLWLGFCVTFKSVLIELEIFSLRVVWDFKFVLEWWRSKTVYLYSKNSAASCVAEQGVVENENTYFKMLG